MQAPPDDTERGRAVVAGSVLAVNDGPIPSSDAAPAGWFPDPLGRYDHRWFNGTTWTADVSVDGVRYVDPRPLPSGPLPSGPTPSGTGGGWMPSSTPQGGPPGTQGLPAGAVPGWHPWQPVTRPSRTLAALSMVGGLVAVATGWMPFLFVVGAAAGITAIVLGVVARGRIRQGRATGSGMAIAGLVLGPVGLALCIVGAVLSVSVWREVRAFIEPGPNDVEITGCTVDGPAVQVRGTIENLDDESHDYVIAIEVLDGRDLVESANVEVDAVAPGEVREWDEVVVTGGDEIADVRCDVFGVNGPFPFGVDPDA